MVVQIIQIWIHIPNKWMWYLQATNLNFIHCDSLIRGRILFTALLFYLSHFQNVIPFELWKITLYPNMLSTSPCHSLNDSHGPSFIGSKLALSYEMMPMIDGLVVLDRLPVPLCIIIYIWKILIIYIWISCIPFFSTLLCSHFSEEVFLPCFLEFVLW